MWRLRNNLFSHIIVQEVGFFDRVRTGELMNRLSEVHFPTPEPLSTFALPRRHACTLFLTATLPQVQQGALRGIVSWLRCGWALCMELIRQ
jgi:hypothetical protein